MRANDRKLKSKTASLDSMWIERSKSPSSNNSCARIHDIVMNTGENLRRSARLTSMQCINYLESSEDDNMSDHDNLLTTDTASKGTAKSIDNQTSTKLENNKVTQLHRDSITAQMRQENANNEGHISSEISESRPPANSSQLENVKKTEHDKKLTGEVQECQKIKHSKCLVFSQWTYMLDLVEVMLDLEGIKHVRLDGSTSQVCNKTYIHNSVIVNHL